MSKGNEITRRGFMTRVGQGLLAANAAGMLVKNASGQLVDGTALNGVADLRNALLSRREAFVTSATEKLLTYALGRTVQYYDMPAIRSIVRQAAQNDYRFSSLVLGVIRSAPFQTKMKAPKTGD